MACQYNFRRHIRFNCYPVYSRRNGSEFLCLSFSIKGKNGVFNNSTESVRGSGESETVKEGNRLRVRLSGRGAVNTTKHLWAGALSAMVSRKQLLKLHGNEETTNSERLIAGAAAGVTATVLCLPLDTIRTRLVAPGGEALCGVIGAFRHIVRSEGFFSLYKGLLPSILSMAPGGAVFYGVYDALKSAYLQSPEGQKRIENMKQRERNALEKLELGPIRTLLHGAIAGACAEAATYPFEVVRRQLQLQGRATKLSTLETFVKIVEQGGVPALYAGLFPSLLQVLPFGVDKLLCV